LILLNSRPDQIDFRLPRHSVSEAWVPLVDTFLDSASNAPLTHQNTYPLQPRSVVVMALRGGGDATLQSLHESHSTPPHTPHMKGLKS
jgi:hypothetical protein